MLKFFFLFLLIISPTLAIAATAGPNSPGTVADDATVGDVDGWQNVNNAKVSDNSYSVCMMDGDSHYLKATNFGFSIPTTATINGILVEVERMESGGLGEVVDTYVKIVRSDGSFGTTNKADTVNWWVGESYKPYGGAADLWGESWTAADINDADFGVGFAAGFGMTTINVDHIRITVYYTPAPFIKAHIGSGFLGAGRY